MIKLKDLQYLIALDDYRHFGQAANACHVSQPTLSGQIKKLEAQLGLTLIERHSKGVLLTPSGKVLIDRARDIVRQVGKLEQDAKALLDPLSGDLHLGLIPTLAPYLLPHIMQPLLEQLPKVSLYLHEDKTQRLLEKLHQGKLDALILPYMESMAQLDCYDLFEEQLTLAVPSRHPLATKHQVTFDDLKGEEVLALEDGHCLREQTIGYCFAAGAEENQRFRGSSLETLRYMVSANMGITVMPELAIRGRQDLNIRYIPLTDCSPKRRIVLVNRSNYTRNALMRNLASIIRRQFN